jgi:hypothetical protein
MTMRKVAAVVAAVAMVGAVPVTGLAQDANGIYGNVYGCAVVAPTSAAWTQIASSDMKDTSTGAALTAGLFLSSLSLVSRDAWGGNASFICLGPAISCPAATTNAPRLDAGTAKSIEVRGVLSGTAQSSITTLSLKGSAVGASNVEVCAHFRKVP